MGKETAIAWCDHTFNSFWGCTEVDPACDNCYARDLAKRWGYDIWGKDKPRRFFGNDYWHQPFKWNEAAQRDGVRRRVFCSSMADVFETYSGDTVSQQPYVKGHTISSSTSVLMDRARGDLWQVIKSTPWLDWLLLTKRADGFRRYLPQEWLKNPQPNVWLGVTIAEPKGYWRWQELAKIDAAVRFVSYEPALAPISIFDMCKPIPKDRFAQCPDWMICGGESGRKSRQFDMWTMANPLMKECAKYRIAFFMKQAGDNFSGGFTQITTAGGKNPDEWPSDLRVQEFPVPRLRAIA
jgi:protein gp37